MAISVSPRADQSGSAVSTEPLAYTYREAAQRLRICERLVWQAVKEGDLEAARFGRSVRIPATALAAFLARRTQAAKSSTVEG